MELTTPTLATLLSNWVWIRTMQALMHLLPRISCQTISNCPMQRSGRHNRPGSSKKNYVRTLNGRRS